jgi:hypothetical protein
MEPELRPEVEPSYIAWCDALRMHTRFGGRQFRVGDIHWSYGPGGEERHELGDPQVRWLPGLSDWVERMFEIPVTKVIVSKGAYGRWQVAADTSDDELVSQSATTMLEAAGRLCIQLTHGQL